jgi:hypothetical protein
MWESHVMLVEIARGRSLPITAAMPVGTFFVVWVSALFVLRWREQRKLQREIDQLTPLQ